MTPRRVLLFFFAIIVTFPSTPQAQGEAPSIVFGTRHGVALRTNGDILTWGGNVGCQLGRRAGNTASTPAVMLRNVKEIAAAGEHTLALTVDGKVYGWGVNGEGQLGMGVGNTYDKCEGPELVPSLEGKTIAHIATGVGFSLAVTSAGDLWCSGDNGMGQCPPAKGETEVFLRVAIPEIAGQVVGVKAGAYHALVLTRAGRLYAFGRGRDGQLGNGRTVNGAGLIPDLTNVVSFAAGIWHSVAVQKDGSVWTWGNNSKSQLCDGTTTNKLVPTKLRQAGIASVSAGGFTTMLHATDGAIYACGDNQFGSLGLGEPKVVAEPTKVPVPLTSHPVLAAGGNNAAFSPDGCAVRVSGDNTYGILGPQGNVSDARTFMPPLTNLSLCAPRSTTKLADVVNPVPRGGASGCWTPTVRENSVTDPRFAPLLQALRTVEEILKKNAAYLAPPEPVRMRSAISAGPSIEGGARIHVKAAPERKVDGTRLWTGECDVIPQIDRIGGALGQVSVYFNVDAREQFIPMGGGTPTLTGTVGGYPEYNHYVLITKDGRLPWIPLTLADKLDVEGARREKALEEWKKTIAGWKILDEAAMQKAYNAVKTSDPAGAEKMLASMRQTNAETRRQLDHVAPKNTALLEKQIADFKKYRASFSAAELAAPAVWGDPTGEGKKKQEADTAALRTLTPDEQKQADDWGRESRALERQAQVEASTNKNPVEAARLRAESNALGLKIRALRAAHMERVAPLISDVIAQYNLTNLRPGDRTRAMAFKADPRFPNYAEPNRIQMIAVAFSMDSAPKPTPRSLWQQKVKETFDFAALAALLK